MIQYPPDLVAFLFSDDPKCERIEEAHLGYYAAPTTGWKLTNHHKTYLSVQYDILCNVSWLTEQLGDLTIFPANLLASTEETKSNITKENMHQKHKYSIT